MVTFTSFIIQIAENLVKRRLRCHLDSDIILTAIEQTSIKMTKLQENGKLRNIAKITSIYALPFYSNVRKIHFR